MKEFLTSANIDLSLWIVAPTFLIVWVFIGWGVKKAVFGWLRHLTSKTATKIDDILIGSADMPVTIMIVVWGIAALAHFMGHELGAKAVKAITMGSKAATLLALIIFVDRVLLHSLESAAQRHTAMRFSQGFGSVIIHVVVFTVGVLMILDSFGIPITPLIASLGLGSLAIALALQPTLENFISGFQILIDQPIRLGNYIKLDSGEEGFVEKIGWRSTWVRQGVNNMIILPNKMLVNARVLNYDYPGPETIIPIPLGVHYASDLEKVERVTVEVATEVMKTSKGAAEGHTPVVRFTKFSASSIDLVAVLKAKAFTEGGLVTHDFIKAATARFAREGIVMPYPIISLDTAQEKAVFNAPQP